MLAIFKRDFKSLFDNLIGWIFLALNLAFLGFYFSMYNLSYGYPLVTYSLSGATLAILITVPILTMRMLAEDRKTKTDQLILTAPVSVEKIVIAKFLSVAAVFTIYSAFSCLLPLLLSLWGDVPYGENYTGILGYYLFGLTCIALGELVSSLTENQIISAVGSFGLLLLGYLMSSITSMISQDGNLLTTILGCYDLHTPLSNLMSGELDITAIIYFLGLIVLFLFLTVQSIQKRRFTVSKNTISTSVFSSVTIVLVLAVVVILNLVVSKLPEKYTKLDVTSDKLYSITDETQDYIDSLEKEVEIYVLSSEEGADSNVKKTLSKYDAAKNISVEYKNPTKNPNFASNYTSESVGSGSIIVVCGDKSKVIQSSELYEYEMDYTSYSYTTTGYDAEGQLTSAIQYVTSDSVSKIYELKGHDEVSLTGNMLKVVEKANISTEDLDLLTNEEVPSDCESLIINAPQTDLSSDDAAKVISYLNKGGNVFVTLDYSYISEQPNLKKVLSANGIEVKDGLVVDNDSSYNYSQTPYYLLPYTISTDASSSNTGTSSVFMPLSLAFSYDEENDSISPILRTSDSTVLKKDIANATVFTAEDGDEEGSQIIGLLALNENGGSVVAYGSASGFSDSADEIVSGRNSELFKDALNYMVTTDESYETIVIASKSYSIEKLTVNSQAVTMYSLLIPVAVPLILLICGIVIMVIRRRR